MVAPNVADVVQVKRFMGRQSFFGQKRPPLELVSLSPQSLQRPSISEAITSMAQSMDSSLPKSDVNPSRKNGQMPEQDDSLVNAPDNGNAKIPSKPCNGHLYLDVPLQNTSRSSLETTSRLLTHSADSENERDIERLVPNVKWRYKWNEIWMRNKGIVFVLVSQFFGSLMNVATRLLETSDAHVTGMDPFQILSVRMSITVVLCLIYMWWVQVPHAPIGSKEVRLLLVARGLGRFFGVYGIYYSLIYLPLGEAVVITFLAPLVACWACSVLINEPFTRMEKIAGMVSLLGVVLIAQPLTFLSDQPSAPSPPDSATVITNGTAISIGSQNFEDVTPLQRLIAIGVALVGVCGAGCAYTTIRWIGHRAHPLISVNYFATLCTLASVVAMLAVPGVEFRHPSTIRQWGLLFFLGLCGFLMQFLLTAGLSHEKSSRSTNFIYTRMLFALFFDKIIWNRTPGFLSIAGSSLILGSTIYVAVKVAGSREKAVIQVGTEDEEAGLVVGIEDREDGGTDSEEEWRGRLEEAQEYRLRTLR